ncbi:MAG: MarR family transcriptional regulator [Ghiorsea sp.]
MTEQKRLPAPQGLGLIMPLMGHLMCYVRHQTSQIFTHLGYDITPEAADALLFIHHFDGLSQKKLADVLGKDKASITRLLNSLVKSQLVERVQDQEDRRIIRAHITHEGKEAFLKIYPELKALSDAVLKPVTDTDFQQAVSTLSTIVSTLDCPKGHKL